AKEKKALPLVMVHGWPGSFYEFHKIIGPLTDPVAHGGKAEDAFHVVCPSLPGFGFSGKPRERGWSSQRMAEVVAKLMARLGYDRYGAQGGDWGGGIVRWLASGGHRVGRALVGRAQQLPGREPAGRRPHAGRHREGDGSHATTAQGTHRPLRLRRHPGHPAADAGLRAQRLAGGARGLGGRQVLGLERPRRGTPQKLLPRPVYHPTDWLLGGAEHALLRPPPPTSRPQTSP